jgi:hypothetical protein
MDMIEVLMGLTSNSEIAECCQDVWQGKPGERVAWVFFGVHFVLFFWLQPHVNSRLCETQAGSAVSTYLTRCGCCCCCCVFMLCSFAGVSTFVSEFVKRKLAEQNRKPGGKKKKGSAAAAVPAAAPVASGVSAASVGLMSSGEADQLLTSFATYQGSSLPFPARSRLHELG